MTQEEYIKECCKLASKLLNTCCDVQPSIELENNGILECIIGNRVYVQCTVCNREELSSKSTGALVDKWNKINNVYKITF